MSENNAPINAFDAALHYAALGYSVFPCIPGTKKPMTSHGFRDATTNEHQIRQWWADGPNTNIGITTTGLIVIDVDKDLGGSPNPWPVEPERFADLANVPTSITPRGGQHYVFRQPQGKAWRNSTSRLAPKVDTRGIGGYIVVAPSVVDGRNYQWSVALRPLQEVPEPPAWLANQLDALTNRKRQPSATSSVAVNGVPSKYVQAALDAELGRVAMSREGSRNSTLNDAAFAMGQFVGGGAIDGRLVESRLLEAAACCGLQHLEAMATIRSGLAAGILQPRKIQKSARQSGSNVNHRDGDLDIKSQVESNESVIIITSSEHEVNLAAVRAIARDTKVFQRGGQLVRIVREPTTLDEGGIKRLAGTPRIAPVPSAIVRDRLAANATFFKTGKSGQLIPASPPEWCVAAVKEYGEWPARVLEGVVDCPVLRSDGTNLSAHGYDRKTGLYLEPGGPSVQVAEQPIRDEVDAAVKMILDMIVDFPFASEAHRAAFVAALLTPFARQAFTGPSPLFAIDSNIRGAGKGLLSELIGLIVSGRSMPIMAAPRDDEEARKRITAIAIAGDPLILIDNIAGALGSPSLDAALTATTWKDRILGRSELVELPLRPCWYCTGNNIAFRADTARRVCHIRLESPEENPEERRDFKHPDLKVYVIRNRDGLLGAALTILRGWFAFGKPDMNLKPWGSFEGWSTVIRNAIVWAGLPDPGSTRTELRAASDTEAQALAAILEGIDYVGRNEGITVSDILKRCCSTHPDSQSAPVVALREALLSVCSTRGAELPSHGTVGMKLHHLKGRVVGGRCLQKLPGTNNVNSWRVLSQGD